MAFDYVELQIHSPSSRRGVRYVRLTPGRVRAALALAGLWCVWALGSAVLAPRVLGSVLGTREYAALAAERSVLGERLRGQVDTLAKLETEAETARRTLLKLHLAYGLRPARGGPAPALPPAAPAAGSIYADTVEYGTTLRERTTEEITALGGLFEAVEGYELSHAAELASVPASCPLRGTDFVLTTTFGVRRSPFTNSMEFHPGIDLAAPLGTEVHAPAEGVVRYAGRYPIGANPVWWRYGTMVILKHGAGFVSILGHLDATRVRVGQHVQRGEVVGTVGNTGWSTSPHLHYELRIPGAAGWRPIDPRLLILDHQWDDEEEVLARGRRGPGAGQYEPLPASVR